VAIEVVNRQRLARIDARRVAGLATATIGAVGKTGASLTVAFVRDPVVQDLNRKYRGKDQPTDVLSFVAADEQPEDSGKTLNVGGSSEYLGDVVISTDTAVLQAREAKHSFEREVSELVIHGVLHLCGYDHETDRGQMTRLELKLRKKLLAW
jgi:probable rRNA maturation factor